MNRSFATPDRTSQNSDGLVALRPGNSRRTALAGVLLCVLAALGYSVVNACLRKLVDCDSVLVILVKESVTVVVVGPWLAWHALRGRRLLPGGRVLLALALAGLLTQLGGNMPNLWAFGVIGLAVALPVMSGTNLAATAILGRVFLGERVSRRTILAIGLLLVSIVLLCLAAPRATNAIRSVEQPSARLTLLHGTNTTIHDAPAEKNTPGWNLAALAVCAACGAGIAYAILVVVIRRNVTTDTPTTAVVFVVTAMGTASLGPYWIFRRGPQLLADVAPADLGLILMAGVVNLLAFLAITKGLQWTAAARANTIMTTQVVLGAVVGVALFGEPASAWLLLGVCLTSIGMILIGREVKTEPETPETPI